MKDKQPDLFNFSATGLNDEFCYNNQGQLVSTGVRYFKQAGTFIVTGFKEHGITIRTKLFTKHLLVYAIDLPTERIRDIQLLAGEDKSHLFALMDAFLRDAKAKQAYAY